MAVSLTKGSKVSLAKAASDAGIASPVKNLYIGLRWDTNRYDGGSDFDLDASVFLCGEDGKVHKEGNFVFYGNKVANGVEHMGDNRTGNSDGDDEVINIKLEQVDADVVKISFVVTIDKADERRQTFGMVENSGIKIMDNDSKITFIDYELGEESSADTAVVVAELYKHNGEWKFNAIGSGFSGGLAAICNNFGIETE